MLEQPQILAFAGSARKDSYNKKLITIAANAAQSAGANVTYLDLRDFPLPLFDADLEAAEGLPEHARAVKSLMKEHQGLLIAAPEYNSSITPLLKNTIDWVSRSEGEEAPLECFTGKVAAIMSTSPGALGGLRGLAHVRDILGNINVLVIPDQLAIPRAYQAFNKDGMLKDQSLYTEVQRIAQRLVMILKQLNI